MYTQQWEDKRSEAFKIADDSTKKVRYADKKTKRSERNVQTTGSSKKVLVRNLKEREREENKESCVLFWEHKICRVVETKVKKGFLYGVVGQNNPNGLMRAL